MGLTSIWHWLIVLVIVLLVFGAGKLPKVAGDLAKGIKNFKAGLKDEDETTAAPSAAANTPSGEPPKVVHAEVVTPSGATTETTVRDTTRAQG